MTDKQIIIDDYFRKIVDINDKIVDYEIKNSEVSKLVQKIEKYNFYIERKEQECEELKLDLIEAKAHSDYLNNLALSETLNLVSEQLDQLKEELAISIQENEEGREINAELKAKNDLLRKTHKTEQDRRRAYEQALTEIKEIAMGIMDDDLEESSAYYDAKRILQKCEVLDE